MLMGLWDERDGFHNVSIMVIVVVPVFHWFIFLFKAHLIGFCLLNATTASDKILKGVLHPKPVFGPLLHFSQKLQHIGNK